MKLHVIILALVAAALPAATASAAPAVRNVAIVVYDGAEILDFAGPAEVLAAAGHFAGNHTHSALDVYLVGATVKPIKAQGFITVTPTYSIDNAPRPDIVVIPGGQSSQLSTNPAMMAWLKKVTAASETTLTVCTGAFPLAETGALDGLDVTTWFGAIDRLKELAPKARVQHGRRFIDNGKYVTTAGVSAGIDGALHLAARLFGRRVADQTARYMEYRWTPEPYLVTTYAYWNPSTDELGRGLQAAEAAADEKRWPEAIAQLKQLVARDKTGAAATRLGDALLKSGHPRAAIPVYAKVATTSPHYTTAIYNLACAHALVGQKPQAMAAIKKAFAAGIKRDQALADPDLRAIKDQIEKLPR